MVPRLKDQMLSVAQGKADEAMPSVPIICFGVIITSGWVTYRISFFEPFDILEIRHLLEWYLCEK